MPRRKKHKDPKRQAAGRRARRKGSGFERHIAKIFAKTVGADQKQVYRTPLSGGHPYAERGDLVIHPDVQARLPFTVECKHYRGWNLDRLLSGHGTTSKWCEQTLAAARVHKAVPLLVVKGDRGTVYCAFAVGSRAHKVGLRPRRGLGAYVAFDAAGARWCALPLRGFVAYLTARCRKLAKTSSKSLHKRT